MGFDHVSQAGFKLLTSGDPPTSASQSAGITGVRRHAWPKFTFIEEAKGKQGTSYVRAREREEVPHTFEPSDLMRTHYHKNSIGELPPGSNHLPPGPFPNLWRLQFKMGFRWGHRAKPYHIVSCDV